MPPRLLAAALVVAALAAAAGCGTGAGDAPAPAPAGVAAAGDARGPGLLTGAARSIDGDRVPLRRFLGGAVLIVNTASRCGYTRQFEGLEALYRARAATA